MKKRDTKQEFITAFWELYEKSRLKKHQLTNYVRQQDKTVLRFIIILKIFMIC